ncbi:MAG: hypothetical protein H6Q73_201 [Firmicutes bacterium]|nr:hypothetical protein [Bacillota bacterium]
MCVAAATIASSLVSAVAGVQSAKSQSSAYAQQAKIAENNAARAESQAANVARSGADQEQQIRKQGNAMMGKQTAMYGASNIDTNSGSAQDVIQSTDYENLMDALTVRHNTANSVYGLETEAQSDRSQASAYRTAASNATKAGWLNAGTSLLTGATTLASEYNKYQSTGGTGSLWGKWTYKK